MENSWQTLQKELENPQTTAVRRLHIGNGLASLNDPRPGVGVKAGVPELVWRPVAPGGEVEIKRVWRAERAGEVDKTTYTQDFTVEPFYLAQYLVTNAQYQAFVEAADGFEQVVWWQNMPEADQRQPLHGPRPPLSNYPRAGLSWYQSVAFARWFNHRAKASACRIPPAKRCYR